MVPEPDLQRGRELPALHAPGRHREPVGRGIGGPGEPARPPGREAVGASIGAYPRSKDQHAGRTPGGPRGGARMAGMKDDGQWIIMMGFLVSLGIFFLAIVISQSTLVGQTTAE